MEKKRSRVISGWRQVAREKPGFAKHRPPAVPLAKVAPEPTVTLPLAPAGEKVAGERWEAEGGHLAAKK